MIAHTDFVPRAYRGNLPAIAACIFTGRELGIGDMASLRYIHVIDGKPTLSAELMVHLVRQAKHSITGTATPEKAVVKGRRADNGDEMEVVWTLEMAKRAGLTGKSNWRAYPEAMLWARAVSQLCRMLFPDVLAGVSYTPEELGSDDVASADTPPEDEPQTADVEGQAVEVEANGSEPEGQADSPRAAEDDGNSGSDFAPPTGKPMSTKQRGFLFALVKECAELEGSTEEHMKSLVSGARGGKSISEFTSEDARSMIERLQNFKRNLLEKRAQS